MSRKYFISTYLPKLTLWGLLLAPAALFAQDEAAVRKVFNAVGDALRQNDYETYIAQLHPDMTIFLPEMSQLGATGAKPESVRDQFSGRRVMDIQYEEVQITSLGDAALVTAYAVGKSTWDGQVSWEGRRKLSSVYVHHQGAWKLLHTHISTTED